MAVSKISMYKQVLVGNFAGDDNEQSAAAKKYASILTAKLTEYCAAEYPNAELDINFELQNASGYSREFEAFVTTDENDSSDEIRIQDELHSKYESICSELERSGEIYE